MTQVSIATEREFVTQHLELFLHSSAKMQKIQTKNAKYTMFF